MTYPHEEPEFHKPNDLPDYLQPEHIKRVMEVNNAVMEASLNCDAENPNCPECGNEKCFEAFKAQAELWGETFDEYMKSYENMWKEGEIAVERQRIRYAYMAKVNEHNEKLKAEKLSKSNKPSLYQNDLFGKAA